MSKHFKISLCLIVLFLVTLKLATFKTRKVEQFTETGSAARGTCNSFLSCLVSENFKQAHGLLSIKRQASVTQGQLRRLWMGKEKYSGEIQSWGITHTGHKDGYAVKNKVFLKWPLFRERSHSEFSPVGEAQFICVEENGQWKIEVFNLR